MNSAEDELEAALWSALTRHKVTCAQVSDLMADLVAAAIAYAAGDSDALTAERRMVLHEEREMSERHSSAASFGQQRECYSGSQPAQARVADGSSAAYQRRYRAGLRGMVWGQPRNGLPWKPYVYRGTGCDIYGEDDDG